jgi:hypothetical protein
MYPISDIILGALYSVAVAVALLSKRVWSGGLTWSILLRSHTGKTESGRTYGHVIDRIGRLNRTSRLRAVLFSP